MGKSSIVIDFGSTFIKCAVLSSDSLKVTKCGVIKRESDTLTEECIKDAVSLIKTFGIKGANVFVTVPEDGTDVLHREVFGDSCEQKGIDTFVEAAIPAIIGDKNSLDKYYTAWCYSGLNARSKHDSDKYVYTICLIKKDIVDILNNELRKCKLWLADIILDADSAVCTVNLLKHANVVTTPEDDKMNIFLDVGNKNVKFVAVTHDKDFAFNLKTDLYKVTGYIEEALPDIKSVLECEGKSEQAIEKVMSTLPEMRKMHTIFTDSTCQYESILSDLVDSVYRVAGTVLVGGKRVTCISKIILSGGNAAVPGLKEALIKKFKCNDCSVLDMTGVLNVVSSGVIACKDGYAFNSQMFLSCACFAHERMGTV